MGFGKSKSKLFDKPVLFTGIFLLLVVMALHLITAPAVGLDLAYWFLIFVVVVIASLAMPKIVYLALIAVDILAFLWVVFAGLGSEITVSSGVLILALLLFAGALTMRFLNAKK
jgi:hypothetical protein